MCGNDVESVWNMYGQIMVEVKQATQGSATKSTEQPNNTRLLHNAAASNARGQSMQCQNSTTLMRQGTQNNLKMIPYKHSMVPNDPKKEPHMDPKGKPEISLTWISRWPQGTQHGSHRT